MADKPSLTNEDKVGKAAIYKEEGNEFFKKKEFKKAVKKYHYALLHLKGIGQKNPITGEQEVLSDATKKKYDDVTFGCYNNLAGK